MAFFACQRLTRWIWWSSSDDDLISPKSRNGAKIEGWINCNCMAGRNDLRERRTMKYNLSLGDPDR